jgi:hypothetical protein
MIQLYCPACENVVWVEEGDAEMAFCPECSQAIHSLGKRKARPVTDSRPNSSNGHVVPARETPNRSSPPCSGQSSKDEAAEQFPVAGASPPAEEVPEVEEDPDFPVPWPEPLLRFVALPYRPEGGCSPGHLPGFFAVLLLGGMLVGWVASALGQIWYLVFLFPLGMGIALAVLGNAVCRWARLRNPTVAGLGGLLAGAAAILAMHAADHQAARRLIQARPDTVPALLRERLDEDHSLRGYLDATARIGLTISGRSGEGINLGYSGTHLYWALELVVVGGLALFGARAAATRPFCVGCGHWKAERLLSVLNEAPDLVPTLRRGLLEDLGSHRPPADKGDLTLSVAVCPFCGTESPVDVRLERLAGNKGRTAAEVVHLTYPGEALPVLERSLMGTVDRVA